MATATQPDHPVQDPTRASEYRCECGNVLRAFGSGRHRVFFADASHLDDPVMNRGCPRCGRGLPGKGTPYR